ncbi:RsiW-degrading membrane proteinase PrsW (M82 family) [Saccharopolyspora erythraea NRRL 2338]|uniref:Integral membrane protein n=2 Tax=Saccharopolyspora erythraea TaxID=1836 RepID=A4FF87_SACEN|nr:PrsW family intramembrane metalloprotease [Saccharopolyspora erythraea]EQD86021.1 membrane protein [Saccharopolyspora erythraea D]PFG96435.1 RsiW-degrading membrane proteinase PrsW (M82 family) [Saccharopolyspora erythraea NRRL 2338]QRK92934.1 PrsW family intramembrane metalloprotease [Saccharopolyspora erythraea]CAM02712.1 putative integral membrane protein [Saccharopolyspora erythraea NRRL 2338]
MPALTPQSILEGRRTNRTPVPLIIGLVVSGICLLLALAFYLATGEPVGVLVGTLLALPTAAVLVGLILLVDRLEPEPRLHLLLAFGWGGGVAIVGALIVNSLGGAVLELAVGPDVGTFITMAVVAPVVEESFKGVLLLLVLWWWRHEIDGPTDGIVYASLCGLGFALVENVLYYMRGFEGPQGEFWLTVLVRGVIAPLGHPLYTALTGLGVAYAATHRGAGRFLAVVAGWFGAVLLHGLWNGSTAFGLPGLLFAYAVEAAVLVVMIVVLVRDRRRLVGLIRTYLPAYVPSGLVQPGDIGMLGTMAGRRQARHWARRQAGGTGVRAMGDYQLAATELALLHDRARRGTIDPHAFHARREAIVGLMRAAATAFMRRLPQAPPPPWAVRQQQSGFFAPPSNLHVARLPSFPPQRQPVPPRGAGGPGQQWPPR